ncbi:MAG: hypothetical protein C0478_08235 [Planctomyces sp.]|nr:hypothetical protein [Planctomyces sp.]
MQATLQLLHKTANIQEVRLRAETNIGRAPECQLKIASSQISRRHCRILVNQQQVVIEDLGSSNGTMVNGALIPPGTPIVIQSGDEITIGPAQFLLQVQGAAPPGRTRPLGGMFAGAIQSLSSTILGAKQPSIGNHAAQPVVSPMEISRPSPSEVPPAAPADMVAAEKSELPPSPVLNAQPLADIPAQEEPPPLAADDVIADASGVLAKHITEATEDPPPLAAELEPLISPETAGIAPEAVEESPENGEAGSPQLSEKSTDEDFARFLQGLG